MKKKRCHKKKLDKIKAIMIVANAKKPDQDNFDQEGMPVVLLQTMSRLPHYEPERPVLTYFFRD